jgi:hypothetical protein
LEKLGFGGKGKKIKDWIDCVDDKPQSAVTLYIYRVGGLAPQENTFTNRNLLNFLNPFGFLAKPGSSEL